MAGTSLSLCTGGGGGEDIFASYPVTWILRIIISDMAV